MHESEAAALGLSEKECSGQVCGEKTGTTMQFALGVARQDNLCTMAVVRLLPLEGDQSAKHRSSWIRLRLRWESR